MSPLRRSNRERFTGWIAGIGTASGHRIVIGHWHTSPYGAMTDVMIENRAGHRILYAPIPQLAEFLAGVYRFHEVQVTACSARRSGPSWTVQAGPLQLSFTIGRRSQWYGAQDLHPIIAAQATLHGQDLGALRPVHPPVGFGFGSVPCRPSLVHLTTMIEAAGPERRDPGLDLGPRQRRFRIQMMTSGAGRAAAGAAAYPAGSSPP
jgi:hypothetical protein